MKVAQVTSWVSPHGGGVASNLWSLADSLREAGCNEVEIFGLEEGSRGSADSRLRLFPISGPRAFGFAGGMAPALTKGGFSLLHSHGLWMYPSVAVSRCHRVAGTPYIVSPHGMLDEWALRNGRLKKQIATVLYERRHLAKAACLHALCQAEVESLRSFGLTQHACIIPNGVCLPELTAGRAAEVKTLLFLGRVHPKKGLRFLIEGWREVPVPVRKGWQVEIAGWDEGGHLTELTDLVARFGLENEIRFIGSVTGDRKQEVLQSCDAMILPSLSEGLPMAVLEAWACAKPVLMTRACNLPEGFSSRAALEIEPNGESVARGLSQFLQLTDAERSGLGKNGRDLIAQKFTSSIVARQMKGLYAWIAGEGPIPPEVIKL